MTAYAEALASLQSGEPLKQPDYITAADTLNMANGNRTFMEAAGDVAEDIPSFIAASVISGANQLYNIPADVGNLFGGEYETSDTGEVISSLDSDLGAFYQENKEGVDLVGFIASSIIPGSLGIKVLNAGQKSLRTAINAGKYGSNTGKALGLLAPDKASWVAKATAQAATNSSVASLNNANALRAVMAGVGQNGLEALAFEVAVTATMFNSPVLENQDFGDFLSNVAWGAGVFGIIGGAVDAAKLASKLKRTANEAALEARPWQFIPEQAGSSNSYEKIALDFETLHNIPKIPEGLDPARAEFLTQAAATTKTKLEQRIRTELGELSGGDQEVASALFNAFKGTSKETKQSAMIGLVETGKVTGQSSVERLHKKVVSGKASIDEINEYAESSMSVAYAKTWGEDIGRTTMDAPIITTLVDTLNRGEVIKVSARSGVTAGKQKFAMNMKTAPKYSVLEATNAIDVNARYIWVDKLPTLAPTATKPLQVNVNDIPMMEKVLVDIVEGTNPSLMEHVRFVGLDAGQEVGADVTEFLYRHKIAVANKLLKTERPNGVPYTQDEIASIVNVKNSALNGEILRDTTREFNRKDMLAMQDHADSYTQKLIDDGARNIQDGRVDIWNIPQHIKLTYDSKQFESLDNFVTENMVIIKEQQKLYQEGTSRASASILGDDYARLEDITSGRVMEGAVPSGAGAGYVTAASSNYGSLAASSEYIGNVTADVIQKFKNRTAEVLTPLLHKLKGSQKASVEWSALNARVRGIEGEYGLNPAGDALEPLVLLRWRADAEEAIANGLPAPRQPVLANPAMELNIPIKNQETRDLMRAHIEINGQRTGKLAGLRSAQGHQYNRSPDVFYPIPVNPQEYQHFAMVTDSSITSGNHSKTLFASSAKELEEMIAKLKSNPQLKVRTKQEAEDYYKSVGQWDYEKTLSNNYLDVEAHRKGVSAPHLVATDPTKIGDDMLSWHMQRETGLVREAVSAKYEVQFEELKRLGDDYTNVGTSQFSDLNTRKFSGDSVANPYRDYIKTALAIKKTADYPWHTNISKLVDEKFSQMYKKATSLMRSAKTDAELLKVNDALKEAGYKGAAYDESMEIFANASAAKGVLSTTVQKANAIMATVVLRWDALNAVNNAVSANVLLGAETKAITRAIAAGDENAVGQLAALTRIAVPGTEETVFSAEKMIGKAIMKFNRKGEDFSYYKQNGFMSSISSQYSDALETLAYNSNESVAAWNTKLNGLHAKLARAGDIGEALTGNKLAEEFNRFVAADVMKQMTDVAVKNNLMTPKAQLSFINTFVNRTQGNYLASQRPMMFHGPIGQAVGLFQTYQFNLLQQMFRHVGEGSGKDAMTLLGLQGTIHGMNGMPAFNAINTNLVGNASGNTEHKDAYDAVYGIAGKQAGDWLTYGAASNMLGLLHPELKINLYTRGDINPRHLTIVPTDPSQVPIIQASAKVFGNIFKTVKELGQGADVSTALLQGLEHNGLSRPLAGLAQTLQGFNNPEYASYSTSKRGNVIAANDLLSIANLARMVGGKPLDEAIAIDATYRYKAYALKDSRKRTALGQSIKTTMMAGNNPTQDQLESFAGSYAEAGGKQEDFAGWMTQLYKTSNLSQSNEIQKSLSSPFSQSMQTIMGGKQLRDFSSPVPVKSDTEE